jgi:hypothetical protein
LRQQVQNMSLPPIVAKIAFPMKGTAQRSFQLKVVDVLLTGKAVLKIPHRIHGIVMGTGAVASDLLLCIPAVMG